MIWKILLNTFKSFSNNRHMSKNGGHMATITEGGSGQALAGWAGFRYFLNGNSIFQKMRIKGFVSRSGRVRFAIFT